MAVLSPSIITTFRKNSIPSMFMVGNRVNMYSYALIKPGRY